MTHLTLSRTTCDICGFVEDDENKLYDWMSYNISLPNWQSSDVCKICRDTIIDFIETMKETAKK